MARAASGGGSLLDRGQSLAPGSVTDGDRTARSASQLAPNLTEEAALAEGGFRSVGGVDEAGRGAWAGPLVAAAVVLPEAGAFDPAPLAGVRDSKLLAPAQREALFASICTVARGVAVGWVAADEIDLLGLTGANELAMVRAVRALDPPADALLVDAFRLRALDVPQRPIVRGDQCCLSIAAASIVAKVVRDGWLGALGERHPAFGFERHRGYGVALHRAALSAHGPLAIHRLSYGPLQARAVP